MSGSSTNRAEAGMAKRRENASVTPTDDRDVGLSLVTCLIILIWTPALWGHFWISVIGFGVAVLGIYGLKDQKILIKKKKSVNLVSFYMIMGSTSAAVSLFLQGYVQGNVVSIGLLIALANFVMLPSLFSLYYATKKIRDRKRPRWLRKLSTLNALLLLAEMYKAALENLTKKETFPRTRILLTLFVILSIFVMFPLTALVILLVKFSTWFWFALPTIMWLWAGAIVYEPGLKPLFSNLTFFAENMYLLAFFGLGHQIWLLGKALVRRQTGTDDLSFWKIFAHFCATLFWFLVLVLYENFWQATLVSLACFGASALQLIMFIMLSTEIWESRWWYAYRAGGLSELFYQLWRYLRYPALR